MIPTHGSDDSDDRRESEEGFLYSILCFRISFVFLVFHCAACSFSQYFFPFTFSPQGFPPRKLAKPPGNVCNVTKKPIPSFLVRAPATLTLYLFHLSQKSRITYYPCCLILLMFRMLFVLFFSPLDLLFGCQDSILFYFKIKLILCLKLIVCLDSGFISPNNHYKM